MYHEDELILEEIEKEIESHWRIIKKATCHGNYKTAKKHLKKVNKRINMILKEAKKNIKLEKKVQNKLEPW